MPKQTLLQKLIQLITNSPALREKEKEKWLQKAKTLNREWLQKLCLVFEEEQERNQSILTKYKKPILEYKSFLDDFQHHQIPKLIREVEERSHKKETKRAEKLLDDL